MEQIVFSLENLVSAFIAFLPNLVRGVLIFLLALYGSAWLARVAASAMERRKMDPELILLLRRVVRWTILILGLAQAAAELGFSITSLVAGLGIVGFTLGFALQDVAKNFVAGILLLLQQPFDIGDAIEVSGYSGTVLDITLRTTELRTWDGRNVLIPNGDVYVNSIVNFSRAKRRRVQLTVGVAYDADLDQVARVALEAISGIEGVLADPAPQVAFSTFGNSAIEFNAFYWIDVHVTDPRSAQDAGVRAIKGAFERAGIEIPYPIQTIFLEGAARAA